LKKKRGQSWSFRTLYCAIYLKLEEHSLIIYRNINAFAQLAKARTLGSIVFRERISRCICSRQLSGGEEMQDHQYERSDGRMHAGQSRETAGIREFRTGTELY